MTDPDPIVRPGRLNPYLTEILQSREEAIAAARAAQEKVGRLLKAVDDLARTLTLRGGVAAGIADELRRAVASPDLAAEPDLAADLHTVIARWEAVVAMLGVDSGDGRVWNPAGEWKLQEPSPRPLKTLPDETTDARVVGLVDRLWRDGDRLYAAGEVWDRRVARAMFKGRLFPGIELDPIGSKPVVAGLENLTWDDDLAGLDDLTLTFNGGEVWALAAVPNPSWADDVRFYPATEPVPS
jgi:hypothetical protein